MQQWQFLPRRSWTLNSTTGIAHQYGWAALVVFALSACKADVQPKLFGPLETDIQTMDLPADWNGGTTQTFEAWYSGLGTMEPLIWSQAASETLLAHLTAKFDTSKAAEVGLRAALLLAKDTRPETDKWLLVRLERRIAPKARGRAAAEAVCARALGKRADLATVIRGHLRALAIGPFPHPDLDVRVECAKAYLEPMDKDLRPVPLSARPVLRFLVRILRAETPAQRQDPPDWPRVETLAWTKTRAAGCLRQWLQSPGPYTADGSWQSQNAWAQEALNQLNLDQQN